MELLARALNMTLLTVFLNQGVTTSGEGGGGMQVAAISRRLCRRLQGAAVAVHMNV